MSFKVYWNNVCLLNTKERAYIDDSLKHSKKEDTISFEYYGLGKKRSLKEKIIEELCQGTVQADLIISTDLDIFQDKALLPSIGSKFSNAASLLPLREEIQSSNIIDSSGLLAPFIVVPMVFVVNKGLIPEERIPYSLEELLDPYFKKKIAFGGIHNSAGRSLLKSIWYLFGKESAEEFTKNSIITSMPAAAFRKVMTGEAAVAIVPSLFAMRAGINNMTAIWPKEGAVAVPSYCTVKKDSDALWVKWVSENILGKSHQQLLKSSGSIIPCNPDVELPDLVRENNCRLLYPDWHFLHSLDNDYFYSLCEKYYNMLVS